MFAVEFQLDLGDIGEHMATIYSQVKESAGGTLDVKILAVECDIGSQTVSLRPFLRRAAERDVEEYVAESYCRAKEARDCALDY